LLLRENLKGKKGKGTFPTTINVFSYNEREGREHGIKCCDNMRSKKTTELTKGGEAIGWFHAGGRRIAKI